MDLYFITGTSTGLGAAITEEALNAGHKVVGIGRRHPYYSDNYYSVVADLSRPEVTSSLTLSSPWADETFNRVVLVNNAGVIEPVKHMGNADASAIQHHYQVNLVAPTILINQFLNIWSVESPEPVILNISSGAASRAIDGWGCYCSAKAGLAMLTQVVNDEIQMDRISCRVYALAPGVVDTPMQATIRSADKEDFSQLDRFKSLEAEGALEEPQKVARKLINVVGGEYPKLKVVDRLN